MDRAIALMLVMLALSAFLCSCWTVDARAGVWKIGVIDSEGDIGRGCEIQKDGAGNLYVVYLRSDLDHLMLAAGSDTLWGTPEKVDSSGTVGDYCAIALTGTGDRKIAYHSSNTERLSYVGPEAADEWSVGSMASSPDVIGIYAEANRQNDGTVSVSFSNYTQESLLLIERDSLGVWSSPVTVDPGPYRGSYSAHAYHPGIGYIFSEYDEYSQALIYIDSVLTASEWETGAAISSADVIGHYAEANRQSDGTVSVSCRNHTQGSLLLIERDNLGVWSAPVTVDHGPYRGEYSSHAHRSGTGYIFSEYDANHQMLIYADPLRAPKQWAIGTIYETEDSGKHVQSVLIPDNRVASVFFHFNDLSLGNVYLSALNSYLHKVIKGVADSMATSANDEVYMDVHITPDWNWHVTYRNGIEAKLYYAYAEDYIITGVEEDIEEQIIPQALMLDQNYPNPFNPVTTISFSLPSAGRVVISIYDIQGRHVKTLIDETKLAGSHSLTWDARNNRSARVASGVYFIRLTFNGTIQTRKLVLLR
jgi:hypothetical protein